MHTYTFHTVARGILRVGPFLLLAVMMTWTGSVGGQPFLTAIGAAGMGLSAHLLYMAFGRRVTLDERGVRFTAWHSEYFIAWGEVQRYGGFVQGRYGAEPVPAARLGRFTLRGAPFLYVSRRADPNVSYRRVDEHFICWEYRPAALAFIEGRLAKRLTYGPSPKIKHRVGDAA